MWDQIDGYSKQYRCYIAFYLMYFLSESYQIVLDRAFDTLVHGNYVLDGFNSVQKQYLDTCLIMSSTPEVDKIDSKRMCVDSMNKKGEVSFAK